MVAPGFMTLRSQYRPTRRESGDTMDIALVDALQLVVGLGLLNVWLVRRDRPTAYRGGSATTLREEFAAYGLPPFAYPAVGILKVASALVLIAGALVTLPDAAIPAAAAVVAALMLGAIAMHLKVRDPLVRALPATAMLAMSAAIVALAA